MGESVGGKPERFPPPMKTIPRGEEASKLRPLPPGVEANAAAIERYNQAMNADPHGGPTETEA